MNDKKDKPAMLPTKSAQPGRASTKRDNSAIQSILGDRLRLYYDDVAREPVPDKFLELLKQLDEKATNDD